MFNTYFRGIFIISYLILSFVILDYGTSLLSEPNTLYVYGGAVIDFTWIFITIVIIIKALLSKNIIKKINVKEILDEKN